MEEYAHRRRPRSWQVHFHGLLVRVRVSRLSKGKVEGNWFRRLFSRWTCFSVVTPRKAPSENWEARKAEVREPQFQCPSSPNSPQRSAAWTQALVC